MAQITNAAAAVRVTAQSNTTEYLYLTFSTDLTAPPGLPDPAQGSSHVALPQFPSLSKYENPQGWPSHYKLFVTLLACLGTFVTTYTPGAYAAGLSQYQTEWGVSPTAVYEGITIFTLCFALAPMFLASLSELTGRRPLFVVAGIVYVASQLGSSLTPSFAGLLATRALAGISCSVFSTVAGGVVSDIYIARERNTAMAIFSGAALCGTGVGPMVSGVITQHLTWRWIFHIQTITCGLMVLAIFFFFPETRADVLLSRKAKKLNDWYEEVNAIRGTGAVVRWKVEGDEERSSLFILLKTSLLRPIHLLVTESVVFWFSLWMSFAWSILYLTFEAVPLIFSRAYGFSPQASGICFLAVSVASIIGVVVAVGQEALSAAFMPSRFSGQPEARLFFACGQSLLLPFGLFWLGATANSTMPWILPVLALGCLTLGIFSVYLAVFNYLADTYLVYASSALAAQSFTRNVVAACLPLAVGPMLDSLGFIGTGCLLGGLGLAVSVVPWVLLIWGRVIRSRSKLLSVLTN